MGHERTTDAATEPLTRAEAMLHASADANERNEEFDAFIKASRQHVEEYLWRSLITQTWTLTGHRFPCSNRIYLPRPPIISVTSISYRDSSNQSQTWSADNYIVKAGSPGFVETVFGVSFPSTYPRHDAFTIVYTAGYGSASAVPSDIKHALKLFIGHYNENREAVVAGTNATEIPLGVKALLAPHLYRDDRVLEYV